MKIAWNRLTPSSIESSYRTVLPQYHFICKPEVYRIKALVFYGLKYRSALFINELPAKKA